MKKLVFAIAIMSSLLGCGPEQSAADRDRAGLQAQIDKATGDNAPFIGRYTGTVHYAEGGSAQAVLNLGSSDDAPANIGTISHTVIPTLKGTLALCLSTGCANPKIGATDDDPTIQIVSSYLNKGQLILSTTQNITNCTVLTARLCSPFTIVLSWNANHDGLVGTMENSVVHNAVIDVKKQQ